jgi:hypothetical protein
LEKRDLEKMVCCFVEIEEGNERLGFVADEQRFWFAGVVSRLWWFSISSSAI